MYTVFNSDINTDGIFINAPQKYVCKSFEVGDIMVTAVSRCAPTSDAAEITISGLKQIINRYEKSIASDRFFQYKLIRLLLVRLQNIYGAYQKDHPECDISADLSFVIANRKSGDCYLFLIGGAPILVLNDSMMISVRLLSGQRNRLFCNMREARFCSLFVKGSFFFGDYRAILFIAGDDLRDYENFTDALISNIINDNKAETTIKKLLKKQPDNTQKLFLLAAILNDDPV